MKISSFEMANVLIVILLLFILTRRKDVTTILMVLFVYGTLHFGFAAIALATNESASLLIALHREGGGVLAKLSTLLLLGVSFVLMSMNAYNAFLLSQRNVKKIVLYILLAMTIIFFGYILNIRQDDWLQFKNVISIEAMLALLLIGFIAASGAHAIDVAKVYSWSLGGLLILGGTVCIATYEVFDHQSWAGTLESSGTMVYRASSILFNPNLFGFWASLVYLGCGYGMYAYKEHRKMMLWGMVLAATAIYLSGSRSAGYLLLGILFIASLLMKQRLRWVPLIVLPLAMLTIYAVAAWLVPPFIARNNGWHEIALLGERFVAAPLYLANYVLSLANAPIHIGAGGVGVGVPPEVTIAIEGRFLGEGRDAGWLVLYQDAGWLGMIAMLWISFMLFLWGVRSYWVQHSAASVYALMILLYCLLTGFVMRFQIFPVWLFVGVALTPCLVFWSKVVKSNSVRLVANARTDN